MPQSPLFGAVSPLRTAPSVPSLSRAALGIAVLVLAGALPLSAQSPHCGTGSWMASRKQPGKPLARAATASLPARTLETPHFAIRYVLRGINQARTDDQDLALTRLVDSLYASQPSGLPASDADAAVIARLDELGAGHPRYIEAMADFFETAHQYYVDTLGMRPPSEPSQRSYYYGAPAPSGGRYPVDVADIGTAYPDFRNQEIYALTFPPGWGGMLIENDFLYLARLDSNGVPQGEPIRSRYQGRVIRDYSAEWDLGLKVTCYHELYHGIQFAYTPEPDGYHFWYETSATGMEERKAPEVDDYLQYLPSYMDDLARIGMLAFRGDALSSYGNGIYHLFLTRELGEAFDVKLWETLSANGNNLRGALTATYAAFDRKSQDVYANYAAQLAFSGTAAANPLPPFSSDLPRWPRVPSEEVDLRDPSTKSFSRPHPPASIRALSLRGSGSSGMALVQPDTLLRVALARLGPESSSVSVYAGKVVSLDIPGEGGEALALLANGSQLASGPVEVRSQSSRRDVRVYPYPNPMNRADAGGDLFFSRLEGPASVTVYSESGVPLRALSFAADAALWSWDMADAKGRQVKPGLYYYRVDGGRLQPLYIK